MANHYQYSREKPLAQPTGTSIGVVSFAHSERHYAVVEIAQLWNLSTDKVRELFENEPGVLVIGELSPRHKRRYVTLRIPQTVLERVHSRFIQVRRPVGAFHYADHLSPSPKELQATREGSEAPTLPVPYLG